MRQIYLLSADNLLLGKEEVVAMAGDKVVGISDRVLVVDSKFTDFKRLAYTKSVYQFLFSCQPEFLLECIRKFNWNKIYKRDFCVRIKNFHIQIFTERGLADAVWRRLKKPKVNLTNPKTGIEFLFVKGKVFCGLLLYEQDSDFFERVAHLRPGFHPTSMSPKLARALINLSGVRKNETLLDPFCGTGGILLESAIVGCKTFGSDVDADMIVKARQNLDHFKLKAKLFREDALKVKIKTDVIVTDPPYGRGSFKTQKLSTLYNSFLANAYSLLRKNRRLVVVFPSNFSFRSKFFVVASIPFYVHKSLTRNIYVLEKR
ncbi:MAG: methyltransferase domain-containing protein [archaeon]